jgi:hypothetical protein
MSASLEQLVNQHFIQLADMLLDVVYVPRIVELLGGRELARRLIRQSILGTRLETKFQIIRIMHQAQDSIIRQFTAAIIARRQPDQDHRMIEEFLRRQGLIVVRQHGVV